MPAKNILIMHCKASWILNAKYEIQILIPSVAWNGPIII